MKGQSWTTVSDLLVYTACKYPGKTALIYKGEEISYEQLLVKALRVACWLKEKGLSPGFRAAILTDNPIEYLSAYFGSILAGGISVGLNIQTTPRALSYFLQDTGAQAFMANKRFEATLKQVLTKGTGAEIIALASGEELTDILETGDSAELHLLPWRSSCDLAQIIYTSGTTGKPKGVCLRNRNLIANTMSIIEYLGIDSSDRVMAVLPFFYSYGNSIMLTHIAMGSTLVVNQNFVYPNKIVEDMLKYRVTAFSGVPSTYAILLKRSNISSYSFPDLRYITQAGAAMAPSMAQRLQKLFPETKIYIMYGQTEASARLSYLPSEHLLHKPGSIGIPIPGVELRLLDEDGRPVPVGEVGEIVARGENIMAGYWNAPDATQKVLKPEGLRTGDLARMDQDGFLYIVSRKSDIIKSGSHRIAPKEIEDVAMELRGVSEAAVVGMPDPILGESIWLFITLEHREGIDKKSVMRHLRRILPAYKVPHELRIVEDFPRTSTGKIQKNQLKQLTALN